MTLFQRLLEAALSTFFLHRLVSERNFPALKPFEKRLLKEVADRLPPKQEQLLSRQIDEINFSQLVTLAKGSRLTMWRLRFGSLRISEHLRIEGFPGETCIAITKVYFSDKPEKILRADVWFLDGFITSLRCHFLLNDVRSRDDFFVESIRIIDAH